MYLLPNPSPTVSDGFHSLRDLGWLTDHEQLYVNPLFCCASSENLQLPGNPKLQCSHPVPNCWTQYHVVVGGVRICPQVRTVKAQTRRMYMTASCVQGVDIVQAIPEAARFSCRYVHGWVIWTNYIKQQG